MVLSDIDRRLLERCLAREPRSWEDFVDRFLGLILHVVNHTSESRGYRLSDEDREDLVAEVSVAGFSFPVVKKCDILKGY